MMKGTPCSSRRRATLKTLRKTHYLARSSNPAKRVRAWAQSRPAGFYATLRHTPPTRAKAFTSAGNCAQIGSTSFVKRRRSNSHDRVMKGSVERQRK
jgi:hypothetical protein